MDPIETLVTAVKANDDGLVEELLARHPELKARLNDPLPGLAFGATPLLAALPLGNRRLIDVLLAAGADIHQRSHWWAGGFGVLDDDHGLTSFLLARGARIDVHAAARHGWLDALRNLISADPGLVHARGGDGQTPLHAAKSVEVARYLVDHGADIDARDVDHESTPAQWMIRDRQAVARYLVGRGCRTDILMAAALGDGELVARCLDADPRSIHVDVSANYFPMTDARAGGTIYTWTLGANKRAHIVARDFGHEDVFSLLMNRSSEPLQLAVACEVGDEPAVHALLGQHPDLARSLSDDDRRRIVHAADADNTTAVRLMLAAGWPSDGGTQAGTTPLHFAAWHGNTGMVSEILKYHPPLEARDRTYDGTPLSWALHGSVHYWHKEDGDYAATLQALLDAGAKAPALSGAIQASQAARAVLERYQATTKDRGA